MARSQQNHFQAEQIRLAYADKYYRRPAISKKVFNKFLINCLIKGKIIQLRLPHYHYQTH